jgi:hypothetical protein
MANNERDDSGRFAVKAEEKREVRSFRATTDTWKAIQDKASEQDMNVADYFEALVNGDAGWESEDNEVEKEFDFDADEVAEILKEALKLKSRQGVLKNEKIKEALELMGFAEGEE